jgi:lipid-A-disaccharide synthase
LTAVSASGPSIFLVAGEVSGDILAAELAREMRARAPEVRLVGVGGPRMAAAGVELHAESTTWGVIGYVEPLLRLPLYLRRLARVEAAVRAVRPDVLVLVDFAAFNLRLAERLGRLVPIVYYAPPMVSVRRGQRARKVVRVGAKVLALLPFEAAAYRAAGADVVFVGHPAVDLAARAPSPAEARARLAIPPGSPVLGLLPGSRRQEIRAHLPPLLDAAALIRRAEPSAVFVLPVPSAAIAAEVRRVLAGRRLPVRVVEEIHAAMRAADVLVVATGTATLEAAVLGVPMVAVLRLPALSWAIATRIVTVRHAALPNLLAGREIIPELLQDRFTAQAVAAEALALLRDAARREAMRAALLAAAAQLGPPGAAGRAAGEVLAAAGRVAAGGDGR